MKYAGEMTYLRYTPLIKTAEQHERDRLRNLAAVNRRHRGADVHELPTPAVPGHCDLCELPTEQLHHDHDHDLEDLGFTAVETHRGWLCGTCNLRLGRLGDNLRGVLAAPLDQKLLDRDKAIRYLQRAQRK